MDLQRPAGRDLEHLAGLLGGAGVELDKHVHDDALLVVLVEADVGEELARARVAEGAVGQRLGGFRSRAGLDLVVVDGDLPEAEGQVD